MTGVDGSIMTETREKSKPSRMAFSTSAWFGRILLLVAFIGLSAVILAMLVRTGQVNGRGKFTNYRHWADYSGPLIILWVAACKWAGSPGVRWIAIALGAAMVCMYGGVLADVIATRCGTSLISSMVHSYVLALLFSGAMVYKWRYGDRL